MKKYEKKILLTRHIIFHIFEAPQISRINLDIDYRVMIFCIVLRRHAHVILHVYLRSGPRYGMLHTFKHLYNKSFQKSKRLESRGW